MRDQVSHPCKPGIKTTALYILIFKPVFCTHDSVKQKIAYIAQRCGKMALKRGKGKGAFDIVRWRPSNFSLLKRDESSLHSKTSPLSPYFSFWHVNNTSWIICGSAYYLLTYEISYLPHRFTCCYRQTARLSRCVVTFKKHISLTKVASCLRSNYTESKDVKKNKMREDVQKKNKMREVSNETCSCWSPPVTSLLQTIRTTIRILPFSPLLEVISIATCR